MQINEWMLCAECLTTPKVTALVSRADGERYCADRKWCERTQQVRAEVAALFTPLGVVVHDATMDELHRRAEITKANEKARRNTPIERKKRNAYAKRKRKEQIKIRVLQCAQCGKAFTWIVKGGPVKRTCSSLCRNRMSREKGEVK